MITHPSFPGFLCIFWVDRCVERRSHTEKRGRRATKSWFQNHSLFMHYTPTAFVKDNYFRNFCRPRLEVKKNFCHWALSCVSLWCWIHQYPNEWAALGYVRKRTNHQPKTKFLDNLFVRAISLSHYIIVVSEVHFAPLNLPSPSIGSRNGMTSWFSKKSPHKVAPRLTDDYRCSPS